MNTRIRQAAQRGYLTTPDDAGANRLAETWLQMCHLADRPHLVVRTRRTTAQLRCYLGACSWQPSDAAHAEIGRLLAAVALGGRFVWGDPRLQYSATVPLAIAGNVARAVLGILDQPGARVGADLDPAAFVREAEVILAKNKPRTW